jgi:hypothetical protein
MPYLDRLSKVSKRVVWGVKMWKAYNGYANMWCDRRRLGRHSALGLGGA